MSDARSLRIIHSEAATSFGGQEHRVFKEMVAMRERGHYLEAICQPDAELTERLREAGFTDLTIYERSGSVGGTWNVNRYPGAACDVQSHLYSFSFEIKTDWTRPYATQPEILRYFEHVVDHYDLAPLICFSSTVTSAKWDEERSVWQLVVNGADQLEADIVISAIGMFNDLTMPDIEGLDTFEGTIFHSARWATAHDLTGERVAVIGTGASAIQFVPEIQPEVAQLDLFQRTPPWVMPRRDRPVSRRERSKTLGPWSPVRDRAVES